MSMLPYPPPYTKQDGGENSLMRVLGGVLALLSLILMLLGIIFHQHVLDLILAIVVGIFALRVLILWLGDKSGKAQQPQMGSPRQARFPMQQPPIYPAQSRLSQPLQPYAGQQMQPAPYAAPYTAQYGQQTVQYGTPYAQSQPLYHATPDPHMEQTVAIPPAEAAQMAQIAQMNQSVQMAQTPQNMPRSVRPQRPTAAPPFPAQPAAPPYMAQPQPVPPMQGLPPTTPALQMSSTAAISPTQAAAQPDALWIPPSYAAVPAPAPIPYAEQSSSWQYDDELDGAPQQQGGNDYGTA